MKLFDGLVTFILAGMILILSVVFNMECTLPAMLSSSPSPFNNSTMSSTISSVPEYTTQPEIPDVTVQALRSPVSNDSINACNDFYLRGLQICSQNLRANCFPNSKSHSKELAGYRIFEGSALSNDYPNFNIARLSLPMLKDDGKLINRLISDKSIKQDYNSNAYLEAKAILDVITELDRIYKRIDICSDAFRGDLDHKDYPFTSTYLEEKVNHTIAPLLRKIEWNHYNKEKNEILDVIIRIGFSLDFKIKECWEKYQTNADKSTQEFESDFCSKNFMYGLCLLDLIDRLNLRSGTDTNAGNRSRRAIMTADSQHITRNDEELERRKDYPDSVILNKISTTSSELVTGDTFVNEQPRNRNEVKEGLQKRFKND